MSYTDKTRTDGGQTGTNSQKKIKFPVNMHINTPCSCQIKSYMKSCLRGFRGVAPTNSSSSIHVLNFGHIQVQKWHKSKGKTELEFPAYMHIPWYVLINNKVLWNSVTTYATLLNNIKFLMTFYLHSVLFLKKILGYIYYHVC